MSHNRSIRLRVSLMLFAAAAAVPPGLQAQQSCDSTVTRAFNEFETARRVQILMTVVDPATCPPGPGVWAVGVQLLAQTLMEDGQDSLAAVWLRWAVRLAPHVQPDTVQFLPRVVTAYRAARAFVSGSASRGDTATTTRWQWPARVSSETVGRLQAFASGIADARVSAGGVGPIGPTGMASVAPGSYAISVSAEGYDSLRVTREVLPGVTSIVEVRLRRTLAFQPPAPPPVVASKRKKKFPVLWVAGGAVALGAVALLAGGGGKSTTGGITLTFPNP